MENTPITFFGKIRCKDICADAEAHGKKRGIRVQLLSKLISKYNCYARPLITLMRAIISLQSDVYAACPIFGT